MSSYSVLPALSLDGILHLDIQDHSYTSEDFNSFVDGLLDNMNPFPQRNSVIIMDNTSIHKSAALEEMVLARYVCLFNINICVNALYSGMRVFYLPPYSPDFNPIEEGFSAMKAWIRSNRDYVRAEMTGELTCDPYTMLWEAVFSSITAAKAEGWFRDCGYIV